MEQYTLLINIILVVAIGITAYRIFSNERKKKNLGEIILKAESKIFEGDRVIQLAIIVLLFYLIVRKYKNIALSSTEILVPFGILTLVVIINLVYYGTLKKGIAQGGIIGENGILKWQEIESFEWGEKIFSQETLILRVDRKKTAFQKYLLMQYLRVNVLSEKRMDFTSIIKEQLKKGA